MKQRIVITIIFTIIVYIVSSIILIQLKNTLVGFDNKITDLRKEYDLLQSSTNSIKAEIESICSMQNLQKIAENKKFTKPSADQIIYIKR